MTVSGRDGYLTTGDAARNRRSRQRAGVALLGMLAFTALPGAQSKPVSKSAEAAAVLAKQLEQAKLQYIATRDPGGAGRFIDAEHFPGSNLMVISAKYATPVLLNEKLLQRKFQDAYIDLNAASERASRIFVEDLLANGFTMAKAKNQPFDAFESRGKRIVFDFDWRKQKLTQEEYFAALTDADAQYARMLELLLAEARKGLP
jgi:hypothetical protein